MLFSLKTADWFFRAAEFARWNSKHGIVLSRRYERAAEYLMRRFQRQRS
jgi:hypothetical protein